MRKWLSRLAFSFIILAAALVYEARQARDRGDPHATRYYIAAAVLAGAGLAGMRERHRPQG